MFHPYIVKEGCGMVRVGVYLLLNLKIMTFVLSFVLFKLETELDIINKSGWLKKKKFRI